MFKYMTMRREMLLAYQKTIVMFRENVKPKLERLKVIIKQCKVFIIDISIWEIPPAIPEQDQDRNIKDMTLDSPSMRNPPNTSRERTNHIQKLHTIRRKYSELFSNMNFSKSAKSTLEKLG